MPGSRAARTQARGRPHRRIDLVPGVSRRSPPRLAHLPSESERGFPLGVHLDFWGSSASWVDAPGDSQRRGQLGSIRRHQLLRSDSLAMRAC
jgi:hypothetical protein